MGIEKRILAAAAVFVLTLVGVIGLSVKLFGIGVPTCLTDVRPFLEGKVIEHEPKRVEIHYVARMWKFEPAEVFVRPGSTADIYLSTPDVTHGMQIVGTNVNLLAVPGAVNYARATFRKAGDYLVVCNEYCGTAHHNMAALIHVTDKIPAPPVPTVAPGAQLLEKYGCTACHSIDGSPMVGPTFKGLYRSKRTLESGATVVADDDYLRESIEKPDAKIVKDFPPAMPEMPIPPDDLHRIIEYIETLK
ncbi:MAG: c-type cytochrome [Thermoanaerobaculia bacterium]